MPTLATSTGLAIKSAQESHGTGADIIKKPWKKAEGGLVPTCPTFLISVDIHISHIQLKLQIGLLSGSPAPFGPALAPLIIRLPAPSLKVTAFVLQTPIHNRSPFISVSCTNANTCILLYSLKIEWVTLANRRTRNAMQLQISKRFTLNFKDGIYVFVLKFVAKPS